MEDDFDTTNNLYTITKTQKNKKKQKQQKNIHDRKYRQPAGNCTYHSPLYHTSNCSNNIAFKSDFPQEQAFGVTSTQNRENGPIFSQHCDDMPELFSDHDDSTAGYDSECELDPFDDVEQAFAGKAVFFDDNNNIISLAGEDLREEVPLNDTDVSTIAIKNSASEISEEGVALSSKIEVEEDRKPAAKSFEQTHTNLGILQQEGNMEKKVAPKVPMVGNIPYLFLPSSLFSLFLIRAMHYIV